MSAHPAPCPDCKGGGDVPRTLFAIDVQYVTRIPCPTCRPWTQLQAGEVRMKICNDGTPVHRWVKLGDCVHTPRFGEAYECSECGAFGHKWKGFSCARRRLTPAETKAERDACPVERRRRGELPIPSAAEVGDGR